MELCLEAKVSGLSASGVTSFCSTCLLQVAGKLHIEISKMGGAILDRYVDLAAEDNQEETSVPMGAPLLIRVSQHASLVVSVDQSWHTLLLVSIGQS